MVLCCSAVSNDVPCSEVGLGGVDGLSTSAMVLELGVESQHHVHIITNYKNNIMFLHSQKVYPTSARYPQPSHQMSSAAFLD
jgi:hypothetical protein